MGYSRSKRTIERVRPILDLVLDRIDQGEIIIPSKNPQKLCYAIRDALAVVRSLPETSVESKYLTIQSTFKLRARSDKIVFEPRQTLDYSDPIIELAGAKTNKMELPDALTLLEVVGAITHYKCEKMSFPNANISDNEFDRLSRWALLNNYIISDTKPLTLIRKHGKDNSSQEDRSIVSG
jgi:hypothetical protein